jgi:hypothetical protein
MKRVFLTALTAIAMTHANAQNPDHLFMVEQAVKAPSGHNTQPWLFRIGTDDITIEPNYDKTLPVVDPCNRELFISLGCAAENLCIAAGQKGYDAEPEISEDGIITIHLRKNPATRPDALFDQIAVRQTNRSVYDGRVIPADTIDLLKNTFEDPAVNARFYRNGTPEFDSIAGYVIAGNALQMGDKAFKRELRSWMRFNKRHQDKTLDGLSYAVYSAPNLPRFITQPIMSGYLNPRTQNKGDRKKMASSSHFVLLTTSANTPVEWVRLGMAMERFLLRSTELGIVHAYMNQPVELAEMSTKLAETLNLPGEYPMILLRIGYGEPLPYSKRMDVKEVILTE